MSNFGNDGQTDAFDDFSNLASAYIRTYNPNDAEVRHQRIAASKPKKIPTTVLRRDISLGRKMNYRVFLGRCRFKLVLNIFLY